MRTDTKTVSRRRQIDYYARQLSDSQRRLAQLREQGIRALSSYDVEIAHQGDAEEALLTAKRLLCHQQRYFQQKIAALKKDPEQLSLL
jgi:hypothetical protein